MTRPRPNTICRRRHLSSATWVDRMTLPGCSLHEFEWAQAGGSQAGLRAMAISVPARPERRNSKLSGIATAIPMGKAKYITRR